MNPIFDFLIAPYENYSLLHITLELVAVVLGLVSVWFAKQDNILVYPSGMISTGIFVYLLLQAGLIGDFMINANYFIMSIYGWYIWTRKQNNVVTPISTLNYNEKKISIFIFPEGTFSMTEEKPLKNFYNGAFKLAIEMQIPIQPILMVDAVDRMHYSSLFTLTPGKNRIVYLSTVKVDGYTMDDIDILKDKVYQMMDEGMRRYRTYPLSN